MTLGEKIKEARKQCGLSQDQLAEKMNVSRSAIAKWETDKGIPDVNNLRVLSSLLNIGMEYLLDEKKTIDGYVVRESYILTNQGKGSKKSKKDHVIREKFPDAKIYPLLGKLKLRKSEKIIDNLLGFVCDAPFGIPDVINSAKNLDKAFYLVYHDEKQFLVTITDDSIEMQRLTEMITTGKFEIGDWEFTKCTYEVK